MGRSKADSAENFPWEYYFDDNEDSYTHAVDKCTTNSTSADIARKAANILGYSDVTGTKNENCAKIHKQIDILKIRLQKIASQSIREQTKLALILYLKGALIEKVDKVKNEYVMPVLPKLTERDMIVINKKYPDVPNTGKAKAKSEEPKKVVLDEKPVEAKKEILEHDVLRANIIVYFKELIPVDGKIKISTPTLALKLKEMYKTIYPSTSIIFSDSEIKAGFKALLQEFKQPKEISQKVYDEARNLIEQSLLKKETSITVVKSEDLEFEEPGSEEVKPSYKTRNIEYEFKAPPSPRPTVVPPIIPPRPSPVPPAVPPRPSKYTERDFLDYIAEKGWKRPVFTSREKLCDYILDQIKKEDENMKRMVEEMDSRYQEFGSKIELLSRKQDLANRNIELLKSMKKEKEIGMADYKQKNDQLKREKMELELKIARLQQDLDQVKAQKQEVSRQSEKKKEICFMMRDWLDQDQFDEDVATNDLTCQDGNICNVDTSLCEEKSNTPVTFINGARITGSIGSVTTIKEHFARRQELTKQEIKNLVDDMIDETENRDLARNLAQNYTSQIFNNVMTDIENGVLGQTAEELVRFNIDQAIDEIMSENDSIRLEAERLEAERLEAERLEAERLEAERLEAERLEAERLEAERLENERLEAERLRLEQAKKELEEKLAQVKVTVTPTIPTIKRKIVTARKPIAKKEEEFVSSTLSKPLPKQNCNLISIDDDVDEKTRIQDLRCDDGMVCNLDKKQCVVATDDDVVVPITIGSTVINVIGSNNILNALKEKIMRAKVKELPTYEYKEEMSDIKVGSVPIVKSERPSLEDVVKGLKSISGNRNLTTNQQKIKVLERQAAQMLKKCVGL